MNFLSQLTPNQMLMLGAALLASPIILSNEKVKAQLKSVFNAVTTKLGGLVSPVLKPIYPKPTSSTAISITTPQDVHNVVTPLMAFFANQQDDVGVQLAGAVGQHMYDHSAKWMIAPKTVTSGVVIKG